MPLQDSEAERRVVALERRLAAAEGRLRQAVFYNQTAAQGGSHIIAQMIRGASGGLSSVLVADFQNELITAYDANGIARAEFGNMPARGNSPAQWGERANDASGNPIFDSMGLIQTATLIANKQFNSASAGITGTGAFQDAQTDTGVSFSLTRQVNIMFLGICRAVPLSNPGSDVISVGASIDAAGPLSSQGQVGVGSADPTSGITRGSTTVFAFAALAAGNHTACLSFSCPNTHTYFYSITGVYIIQLGG